MLQDQGLDPQRAVGIFRHAWGFLAIFPDSCYAGVDATDAPDILITTMQTLDSADRSGSITASTSLVRRVKSQDQDAWRRLVNIYGWSIYRWARRSGLQVADAEDVVGEVFAEVVRGIERFQHDGRPHSFRRWLRTLSAIHVRKNLQNKGVQSAASGGTTVSLRVELDES